MTLSAPGAAPDQQNLLVAALAGRGDNPAVLLGDRIVTYAELSDRVDLLARQLGPTRRLVLLEGSSTLGWLVGYLAALAVRCPVLLVAPGDSAQVVAVYDPDVRLTVQDDEVQVLELRPAPAQNLHPDLALLLSTSGSSGSPKLVRLSRANLAANAAAVADSLGVRAGDRAITTLPVHYCYGLSVVHSHLLRGAALVLTDLSVLDEAFWELFERTAATCFAGVPFTFELLDRVRFAERDLPSLRYVTQAGGRLAPERVRSYAELGVQRGWDLVVMYGQTEATARMAVLSPELAASRPATVGVPLPGGAFFLERTDEQPGPVRDGEVGELVYTGPNVMLGYATCRADLARGAELTQLRTGDLARRAPDGLYEVVGRASRFLKLFGLRLDQGHLEGELQRRGVTACCEPTPDGRLGVAIEGGDPAQGWDPAQVTEAVLLLTGLPRHAVLVVAVGALPRLLSGKPDHQAVRSLLSDADDAGDTGEVSDVRALFAAVLGGRPADQDTFVGLGGDSLSYVEMTVRLERLLEKLPADWHLLSVADLSARTRSADRRPGRPDRPSRSDRPSRPSRSDRPGRQWLDMSVALRAVAIVLVVGSHSKVFDLLGGAHLMLVLAGYHLARFQLPAARRARAVNVARTIRRIAVPAGLWSASVALLTGAYGWQNVLLVNQFFGPQHWGATWNLWFLEAIVTLMVAVTALLSLRPVDRWYRRQPYVFALVLVGLGLLVRFGVLAVPTGPRQHFTAQAVLWLFALGMAAAHADSRAPKAVVLGLTLWGVWGMFGDPQRELVIGGGVLLLVTVARLPSHRLVTAVVGRLASASLYIYITHWQVYPLWEPEQPLLAFAASLAVGVLYWRVVGKAGSWIRTASRSRSRAFRRWPAVHELDAQD